MTTSELIFILHSSILLLCFVILLAIVPHGTETTDGYCEPTSPKNVHVFAQPFNAWTNLALLLVSWIIVIGVYKSRLWKLSPWYSVLLPLAVMHMGLASFVYHTIVRSWSGTWDFGAILIYVGVEASMTISNVSNYTRWIWLLWLAIMGFLIYYTIDLNFTVNGDSAVGGLIFAGLNVLLIVLIEMRITYNHKPAPNKPSVRLLLLIVGGFFGLIAVCLWVVPDDHSLTCTGVNLYGHGLWHMFISVTVCCLFGLRVPGRQHKVLPG
jgi:hypothetical protein